MNRPLLLGAALVEALAPNRLIAWGERLAVENPDDARLRPWTVPMARLEGLAFCWLVLRGRATPEVLGRILAPLGVLMCLFPRAVLASALAIAYENPDEIETKPWVAPVTRGIGVLYVAVALFSRSAGEPRSDDSVEALEDDGSTTETA